MMGVKEQYCLACGKICGPINSETFLPCITPGCKGKKTVACWGNLGPMCEPDTKAVPRTALHLIRFYVKSLLLKKLALNIVFKKISTYSRIPNSGTVVISPWPHVLSLFHSFNRLSLEETVHIVGTTVCNWTMPLVGNEAWSLEDSFRVWNILEISLFHRGASIHS